MVRVLHEGQSPFPLHEKAFKTSTPPVGIY